MKAMETSNGETTRPHSEDPEPQLRETQTDERTEVRSPELRDWEEMLRVLWQDRNRRLNDQRMCPQGRAWNSEPSTPRGERKGLFFSVASLQTEKLFELILNSQRGVSSQRKPRALTDCLPQQLGQQVSPAEGEKVPAEGEKFPAEGEKVPVEGGMVPVERLEPAEREEVPSETGAEPAEREEIPVERVELAEGAEDPAEGKEVRTEGEKVPVEGEEIPAEDKKVPVEDKRVPVDSEEVPGEGSAVPTDGEVDPAERAEKGVAPRVGRPVSALRGVFPAEKAEPDDELYNTIMTHQSASARIEDQRSRRPAREEFFDLLQRVQEGRMDEQRSVMPSRTQPKPESVPQPGQRARQPSLLLPLLRGISQRRTNSN